METVAMGLRQHQGNTATDGQGKIKKRALLNQGRSKVRSWSRCGNTSTATLRVDRTTYDRTDVYREQDCNDPSARAEKRASQWIFVEFGDKHP